MASSSKRKGDAFEREVVAALNAGGVPAARVPLSGAVGGGYAGDISALTVAGRKTLECKRRARSFGTISAWLGDNYALIVRDDRSSPLVVMRLEEWAAAVRPRDARTDGD